MTVNLNNNDKDVNNEILAAALDYQGLGYSVIPIIRGMKKPPKGETWVNRCFDSADKCPNEEWKAEHPHAEWGAAGEAQVKQWFGVQYPNINIGVLTGETSGIDAIDEDGPHAHETLVAQSGIDLPDTVTSVTGRDDGGKQRIFQYHGGGLKSTARFCSNGNGSQCDIRTDGGLIVVHPSIHKSGKRYEWEVDPRIEDPAPFPPKLIKFIHERQSKGKTSTKDGTTTKVDYEEYFKNGIPDGAKHHGLFNFACKKISQGLPYPEVLCLTTEVARRSDPPPKDGAEKAAKDRVDQAWAKYGPEAGFDNLDEIPPSEWPDPEPIKPQMLPVEPFREDMLPEPLLPMVKDIAHRMSVPMDYVAIPLMIVLASIIGTGCLIRPKLKDDWEIVPNIWGGISGPPSRLKTPAMAEVISKSLGRLEVEETERHGKVQAEWMSEKQALTVQKGIIKDEYKKALKDERKDKLEPKDSVELLEELNGLNDNPSPSERRYKVNDCSIEKMVELLAKNAPRGLLYYRDELIGLFKKMDKPGHEQDRAFLIESWNGKGSHTDDRIGRGTVKADNLCVSLVGTIQPGRLVSYMRDALSQDANDGFPQRLQLMVHPDVKPFEYIDEWPDKESKNRVYKIIKKLADEDFSGEGFQNDEISALFKVF